MKIAASCLAVLLYASSAVAQETQPLVIGETFTLQSRTLNEQRRINVYLPYMYADTPLKRFPVLYMPDGGVAEDFIHVAGLLQVSIGNGTMRPFILVGIENTQRRRDMTGPTEVAEDRKIAPVVGGSASFRKFIADELIPSVQRKYRTTSERAIIGESLAGLFVVETFMLQPDLFNTYIAFDPSLWWNKGALVKSSEKLLAGFTDKPRSIYIGVSGEGDVDGLTSRYADILAGSALKQLDWRFLPLPAERHSTIYHPAALQALRDLFKPDL